VHRNLQTWKAESYWNRAKSSLCYKFFREIWPTFKGTKAHPFNNHSWPSNGQPVYRCTRRKWPKMVYVIITVLSVTECLWWDVLQVLVTSCWQWKSQSQCESSVNTWLALFIAWQPGLKEGILLALWSVRQRKLGITRLDSRSVDVCYHLFGRLSVIVTSQSQLGFKLISIWTILVIRYEMWRFDLKHDD